MPATQSRARSAEAKVWQRLYKTPRWRAIRTAQLTEQPLCVMCLEQEIVTAANTVDHVTPHKGDEVLFWSGPFQSLCASCHSSRKQREEHGRKVLVFGLDGYPINA